MDLADNLITGFSVAFQPHNIFFCFVGVLIGTLIGVLPGIGPVGAMSILLPVTFGISPVTAIIMLSGIYYGAQYGGSTTSILVGIPGEAASVVTMLDGHQMALQGRAGPALGIAAFGSGNIVGVVHGVDGDGHAVAGVVSRAAEINRAVLRHRRDVDGGRGFRCGIDVEDGVSTHRRAGGK